MHLRLSILAVFLASLITAHAEIFAGIAKVDITDRTVPVNDPCFAKALVLKSGETTAVLVTVDAVAIGGIGRIGNGFLANVRQEIGDLADEIIINASHTATIGTAFYKQLITTIHIILK